MAITADPATDQPYIVVDPVDENGTLTVVECGTDETYRVVDYADELLAEKVDGKAAGSSVRLELAPVEGPADEWTVTRVRPGAPVVPGA